MTSSTTKLTSYTEYVTSTYSNSSSAASNLNSTKLIDSVTNSTHFFEDVTKFITTPRSVFETTDGFGILKNTSSPVIEDTEIGSLIDYNAILERENHKEATALIPVTVYLIILMIIGIFGNLLVLYVYKFRFKRSTSRVFILSLAVFDLLTCLLGMPFHIMDMIYPLMFVWDGACKCLGFALSFTILASIFVLDLIAIDRYRKICIPFQKQLSAKGTKITCWVVALICLLLATPMLFIYGSVEADTKHPNVTGKECYISADMWDSDFPMIYNAINILIFLVSVFILTGLYIKVGIVVWQRKSFHDSHSSRNGSKRSTSGTSTPDTTVIQMHSIIDDSKQSVKFDKGSQESAVQLFSSKPAIFKTDSVSSAYNSPRTKRKEESMHRKKLKRLMSELSSTSGDEGPSERGNSKFNTKKQMRTIRITTMLFLITLIFIISFMPYLIIEVLNSLNDEFWNGMSMSELVIFNFLLRTYFINNMVNPIIYWFLDKKFKQEVKKFFRDIRKCKWSRTFRLDAKSFTS